MRFSFKKYTIKQVADEIKISLKTSEKLKGVVIKKEINKNDNIYHIDVVHIGHITRKNLNRRINTMEVDDHYEDVFVEKLLIYRSYGYFMCRNFDCASIPECERDIIDIRYEKFKDISFVKNLIIFPSAKNFYVYLNSRKKRLREYKLQKLLENDI